MENIFVSVFEVESEAYQALSELKNNPGDEKSIVSSAALIKKTDGVIKVVDSFDTGTNTLDDTAIGSLVGMCVGIIGGPIGMLLGASYGAMTGMAVDSLDAIDEASMLEQIANKLDDGTAIIGLAVEEDESILDGKLGAFKTVTARFDAAVVALEVEAARDAEKEMERLAKLDLRKQKKEEFKDKVEEKRSKIKAEVAGLKEKLT